MSRSTAIPDASATPQRVPHYIVMVLIIGVVLAIVECYFSVTINNENFYSRYSSIFRTLGCILVGACLAVSGTVMQYISRNTMTSPSTMGLTQGTALALCIIIIFSPSLNQWMIMVWAIAGAALGGLFAYSIAKLLPWKVKSLRQISGGIVAVCIITCISIMMYSSYSTIDYIDHLVNPIMLGNPRFTIWVLLPVTVIAILICWSLSLRVQHRSDAVRSVSLSWATLICMLMVILMTSISTMLAGPLGLVGIIIPSILRFFLKNPPIRWLILGSAIYGSVLILGLDIISRTIDPIFDISVMPITVIIGAPFLIYQIGKEIEKTILRYS
ncbi:iron chelate uptake ABC transporter family permease subunit [Paenibacillus sp. PsM32]|uniref:FecCD family ABC transporter permease n=1 Tax=Paenibacillus sp. PsM32 TaxID=3030536 RepID=UPI00263B0905|nr:iron chelate uptake ABC transporter family permease subunit [Paenibacillus sp. PsM32]MDN4619929.1 iron chelate uptake ABC transporter family permease subunit [Paenibacillus sp. PsM32]